MDKEYLERVAERANARMGAFYVDAEVVCVVLDAYQEERVRERFEAGPGRRDTGEKRIKMIIPDVIYLQWFVEDGEVSDNATWCVDRIYETDVEYRRATSDDELLDAFADLMTERVPDDPEEIDTLLREAGLDPVKIEAKVIALIAEARAKTPSW